MRLFPEQATPFHPIGFTHPGFEPAFASRRKANFLTCMSISSELHDGPRADLQHAGQCIRGAAPSSTSRSHHLHGSPHLLFVSTIAAPPTAVLPVPRLFTHVSAQPMASPTAQHISLWRPRVNLINLQLDLLNRDGTARHSIAVHPHPKHACASSWPSEGRRILVMTRCRPLSPSKACGQCSSLTSVVDTNKKLRSIGMIVPEKSRCEQRLVTSVFGAGALAGAAAVAEGFH